MDRLAQDVRYAFRQLRRRPVFAVVAALSLAIGVGANTAIFSAVNSILLRPVPGVQGHDRVVEMGRSSRGQGFDTFAYPDFVDLREQVSAFETAAAFTFEVFAFTRGDEGQRITGMHVSPEYFDVMGLTPARGRFFTAEEGAPGAASTVVVLSHQFWQDRLGGEPDILGQTIRVNRVPFTVVGIAPANFQGHTTGFRPDVYVPMGTHPMLHEGADNFENRRASWHQAVARLTPDATVEEAERQMKAVYARLAEAYPESNARRTGGVVPLGLVPGGARSVVARFLGVLMALVGLILLVTCANVAGMFVARASAREKEIAVRLSLGSSRWGLIRQLLTESLAIFVVGGVLGTAAGLWLLGLLPLERLPVPIPVAVDLSPDPTVLLFALGVTLGTGVIFGLLPALQATRLDLASSLKDDGSGRGGSGVLRRFFVTGQVGFSLMLLASAGLFLRSLQQASEVEAGFDASDAYLTSVDLSLEGYEPDQGIVFQRDLLDRLVGHPGVQAAGLSLDLPLDLGGHGTGAYPEGWTDGEGRDGLNVDFNFVSPGYFSALAIPVLEGRSFTDADVQGTQPVVVVSETMAERVWPGESALGRRLRVGLSPISEEWRTVVGVVEDVKSQFITDAPRPFVYVPMWQAYEAHTNVVVRAPGGLATVAPLLRQTILDVDRSVSLTPVVSLENYTSLGILPQRVAAGLTSVLGALALLLAGIGVYGVVAFAVSRRTREIGVRMALGAGAGRVVGLVVRRGLLLALPGIVVGGVAAVGMGFVMRSLLLGVSPVDPVALGGVSAILLAVVLLASLVPARRASAVEPVKALRAE